MNLLQRVWRSSLGKKYLMALTGLALFGFWWVISRCSVTRS